MKRFSNIFKRYEPVLRYKSDRNHNNRLTRVYILTILNNNWNSTFGRNEWLQL